MTGLITESGDEGTALKPERLNGPVKKPIVEGESEGKGIKLPFNRTLIEKLFLYRITRLHTISDCDGGGLVSTSSLKRPKRNRKPSTLAVMKEVMEEVDDEADGEKVKSVITEEPQTVISSPSPTLADFLDCSSELDSESSSSGSDYLQAISSLSNPSSPMATDDAEDERRQSSSTLLPMMGKSWLGRKLSFRRGNHRDQEEEVEERQDNPLRRKRLVDR